MSTNHDLGNLQSHIMMGPFILTPEAMVANQQQIVEKVIQYVSEVRRSVDLHGTNNIIYPIEANQTISIIGGRGAGKTSILLTICHLMRSKFIDVAVADMLIPDRISTALHLPIGPALIRLIERALPPATAETDVTEKDEVLKASWAVRIPETFSVISRESISLMDWTDKLSHLVTESMDIAREFQQWVVQELDRAGKRILIVPIDDADIALSRAEEVVDLVRTYLAHPRIVTVIACDISALERRIRNVRLAELPPIPDLPSTKEESVPYLFGMSAPRFKASEAQSEAEYVEALVRKVLPPALRYSLSPLSPENILNKSLLLPGREEVGEPLVHLIARIDELQGSAGCPPMAPLFEAHPLIFNGNIRTIVNQYIRVTDTVKSLMKDLSTLSTTEKNVIWQQSRSRAEIRSFRQGGAKREGDRLGSPSLTRRVFPSIQNVDQFIVSRAQMDLVRGIMGSGDFSEILQDYAQTSDINIETAETMHEFAMLLARELFVSGSINSMCAFRIGEKRYTEPHHVHILGLVLDWLRKAGMPLEMWLREFHILSYYIEQAFRSFPIPNSLAQRLSARRHSLLLEVDPSIELIERTAEKKKYFLGVRSDLDRLFPFYITDTITLGTYIHLNVNREIHEKIDEAFKPYMEDDAKKGTEDTDSNQEYFRPGVRIMGLLAIQTGLHMQVLESILLYGADSRNRDEASRFEFNGNNERPWIISQCQGCLPVLRELLDKSRFDLSSRLLSLAYLADLPTRGFWSAIKDNDVEMQRRELLSSVQQLLDELSEEGVTTERRRRTWHVGKISSRKVRELEGRYTEVLRSLPLDWERRGIQIQSFIEGLRMAKFSPSWDPFTEPPPSWTKIAEKMRPPKKRKSSSVKRTKKRST